MNTHIKLLPFLVALVLVMPTSAQPTKGAYVTDPQSEWVADQSTDAISTASKLLCYMASTRPDAMVNKGQYIAFINEPKCDSNRGDASASTNSGGGGSTQYTRMSVTSTRDSNTAPQIVKGHAEVKEDVGTVEVYFYGEQTAAPSAIAPNGEAFLDYAGTTVDGSVGMRGRLTATATGLEYSERQFYGGQNYDTRLKLTVDGDNGSGIVQAPDQQGGGIRTYTFGYNGTKFCRSDGATEVCFSRKRSDAKKSTWRYGVYNADGSRYDVGTPGFSVKTSSGAYGWANYWGIWLPAGVQNGETVTSGDGTKTYTVKKSGGRLIKRTKKTTTLAGITNVPIKAWLNVDGNGEKGYTFYWNQATSKFVVTAVDACGNNGCFRSRVNPAVELTAQQVAGILTDQNSGNTRDVWGWSDSLGGSVTLPYATVSQGAGAVSYRFQETVRPGDSTVPSTLKCLRDCPTAATIASFSGSNSPYSQSTTGWDIDPNNVVSYTWDSTNYDLKAAGVAVATPTLSTQQWSGGAYSWGFSTGTLIGGSENMALVACPYGNGAKLCGWKADDAYTTTYEWQMGPNDWNTATFLQKSDNTFVAFTAPQPATFGVPNDAKYGEYAGSTMQLQYQGFGELHGIPGACFSTVDNSPADCGPNTRWVPAFAIADGSTVTIGGETKYVKGLESEIRFAKLAGNAAANAITMGGAVSLPATMNINSLQDTTDPSNSANSAIYPGAYSGVNFGQDPAVIHGAVQ